MPDRYRSLKRQPANKWGRCDFGLPHLFYKNQISAVVPVIGIMLNKIKKHFAAFVIITLIKIGLTVLVCHHFTVHHTGPQG